MHASENNQKSSHIVSLYESLYEAIQHDSEKEVEQFLKFGADINHRYEDDKTPLMIASSMGSIGAVRTLLENDANPYLTSAEDMTAMDYAKENSDPFIIAVLEASTKQPSQSKEEDYSKTVINNDTDILETIPEENEVIEVKANAKDIQTPEAEKPTVVLDKPIIKPVVVALATDHKENRESVNDKIKKIGIYRDITGKYEAMTNATFTECGAYNNSFEYSASEEIINLQKSGKFKITYEAPLLNCKGTGRFTNRSNSFKGKYNCNYQTERGFNGTLRMKISGTIIEDKLIMKYKGSDTSPGVTCNYTWERTLNL